MAQITASQSVVMLDGSMGQELVHRSKTPATPLWATQALLDDPQLVVDLHADYIRAGARVLTLNTYSCTPERLLRHGLEARFETLQSLACELITRARTDAGIDGVNIAGCLPPLVTSYRPDKSPDPDTSYNTYCRIVEQQVGTVDMFLCETVSSIADARAVTRAAKTSGKTVWVAFSVADDGSGTLRSGEPLAGAIEVVSALGADATLLNCSKPESIDAAWSTLSASPLPYGAYANGFTAIDTLDVDNTVAVLSARTDLGPSHYADKVLDWVQRGATIVGGCCEMGPEHIRATARRLSDAGYTLTGALRAIPQVAAIRD